MAEKAVPPLAVLALLSEEAPIDGDSSRVANDGLDHAPDEEQEEEVKDDEEDDEGRRMQAYHVLEDEDVVIEGYETYDPDEVRITHPAAAHLLNDYYIQL